MLILALILSVIMGMTMGMLGGGGSILTVPILIYVLGLETKSAIATSLVVVISTGAISLAMHARAGNVRWSMGATFGAVAMVGAFAGGYLAQYIPGAVLLIIFAGLMFTTATAMLRRRDPSPPDRQRTPQSALVRWSIVVLEGLAVGLATGLVGAGGGFLVVPVLVLLGGMNMHAAVGTALLVIVMNSSASLLGYLSHVPIDYRLAAMVSGMAILGTLVGSTLVNRMPHALLRKAFAWFVLVMAVFILSRQISAELLDEILDELFTNPWEIWALALALISIIVVSIFYIRHGRRHRGAPPTLSP